MTVELSNGQILALSAVVMLGMEVLTWIVPFVCDLLKVSKIPIKGKHLDELESIDIVFIRINRCLTCLFVQQQEPGRNGQRARKGYAPLHAARQLTRS